jgi:hypothetical protein
MTISGTTYQEEVVRADLPQSIGEIYGVGVEVSEIVTPLTSGAFNLSSFQSALKRRIDVVQMTEFILPTANSTLAQFASEPLRPSAHDSVDQLILEAKTKLSLYFPGKPLKLREQADPSDGSVQIILGVQAGRTQSAYEKFELFADDWWTQNRDRADGALIIKIDG